MASAFAFPKIDSKDRQAAQSVMQKWARYNAGTEMSMMSIFRQRKVVAEICRKDLIQRKEQIQRDQEDIVHFMEQLLQIQFAIKNTEMAIRGSMPDGTPMQHLPLRETVPMSEAPSILSMRRGGHPSM